MRFINPIGVAAAAVAVLASPIEPVENNTVLPLKHVSSVKSVKGIVNKGLARIQKFNGVKALESNDASSGSASYPLAETHNTGDYDQMAHQASDPGSFSGESPIAVGQPSRRLIY
ncbi:uncharacterized protein G6M90_00g095010 [Metarhizium brunneum]|uniref:Uncharacterized protein n=1 Tax=Metarhizium brunneum TaxID=500148 RepID=A0A7D5V4D1_9HYPO